MTESMEKDLARIFYHFGPDNQRVKLVEECEEYIESMSNEEIADVFVLSAQHVFNNSDIFELVKEKIIRTIKRIESGYYEPR